MFRLFRQNVRRLNLLYDPLLSIATMMKNLVALAAAFAVRTRLFRVVTCSARETVDQAHAQTLAPTAALPAHA